MTMIQIDMPMPKSCYECRFEFYGACNAGKMLVGRNTEARHANCPLREVKEGQKDKYVAWLEKQITDQTKKSYPEMVLAIYDAGYAYDAIRHLTTLLEENNDH